jgi:hypothetical protein
VRRVALTSFAGTTALDLSQGQRPSGQGFERGDAGGFVGQCPLGVAGRVNVSIAGVDFTTCIRFPVIANVSATAMRG